MKMFMALIFGIPCIIFTVTMLMPFIFIGLVAIGIVSIITQIQIDRKVKPDKVLKTIQDQLGWKN